MGASLRVPWEDVCTSSPTPPRAAPVQSVKAPGGGGGGGTGGVIAWAQGRSDQVLSPCRKPQDRLTRPDSGSTSVHDDTEMPAAEPEIGEHVSPPSWFSKTLRIKWPLQPIYIIITTYDQRGVFLDPKWLLWNAKKKKKSFFFTKRLPYSLLEGFLPLQKHSDY